MGVAQKPLYGLGGHFDVISEHIFVTVVSSFRAVSNDFRKGRRGKAQRDVSEWTNMTRKCHCAILFSGLENVLFSFLSCADDSLLGWKKRK